MGSDQPPEKACVHLYRRGSRPGHTWRVVLQKAVRVTSAFLRRGQDYLLMKKKKKDKNDKKDKKDKK